MGEILRYVGFPVNFQSALEHSLPDDCFTAFKVFLPSFVLCEHFYYRIDENNLGKERSKRDARPEPKDIPEPLPLNVDVARNVLKVSDETFLSMLPPGTDLQGQIDKLDRLVRKSFEIPESNTMSAYEFNYYSYIHFRAFCKIMVDSNMPIDRKKFENELG